MRLQSSNFVISANEDCGGDGIELGGEIMGGKTVPKVADYMVKIFFLKLISSSPIGWGYLIWSQQK